MKVCLIDADSTIPNLALMKLSRFHKNKGDNVELKKLNISYYIFKSNKNYKISIDGYDKVYCSSIFSTVAECLSGEGIDFGGSGFSLTKKLGNEIENLLPDYSIYPENDISYGFISRGCIRDCSFCSVRAKEGYIKQVANLDDIIRHKKVKFLDNNFLALPNHKEILLQLIKRYIKCQFNQGLDIRLVDEENAGLLRKLNYLGEYLFAFDDINLIDIIEKKLRLLSWRKPWQFKFYVYVSDKMPTSDTVRRLSWLKEYKILPYIMRDLSCWSSNYKNFYTDIGAWGNQVNVFKKLTFFEFLNKRHTSKKGKDRIEFSKSVYLSEN